MSATKKKPLPSSALIEEQCERDHIHAYLENQRRLRGTDFHDHIQDRIDGGREAIGALASARITQFTLEQCADVACFMHCTAPADLLDPKSHEESDPYMGFVYVMVVLEESIRECLKLRRARR
jgi:hypothetical protein